MSLRWSMILIVCLIGCFGCGGPIESNSPGILEAQGLFSMDENRCYYEGFMAEEKIDACEIPIPDGLIVFDLVDGSQRKFSANEDGIVVVSGVPAEQIVRVLYDSNLAAGFMISNDPGEFDDMNQDVDRFYVGLPAGACIVPGKDAAEKEVQAPV